MLSWGRSWQGALSLRQRRCREAADDVGRISKPSAGREEAPRAADARTIGSAIRVSDVSEPVARHESCRLASLPSLKSNISVLAQNLSEWPRFKRVHHTWECFFFVTPHFNNVSPFLARFSEVLKTTNRAIFSQLCALTDLSHRVDWCLRVVDCFTPRRKTSPG